MNEETKQIMADVLKYKGSTFSVLLCIEEMAELSKELLKNINRGKDNRDDIVKEIADVMIVLERVKMAYKISDKQLYDIINEKELRKWPEKIKKWKSQGNE